jgi:molybdopterin synthase catalytic subunit
MGGRVKVTVRCFASVRELFGRDTLELDVPDHLTVAGLKDLLEARAPDLRRLRVACAVNRAYASADRPLADGDEVAFIPPISGGSGGAAERFRFDLVHDPLDPHALEVEVRTDEDGAVVTFAGVTRNHNDGATVLGLRYEAYAEMAAAVMAELFAQAAARFAIGRARVAHRLGEVAIGEASVVVVVAAAHRGPAFDACRFLMDSLKARVPIFKQERLAADGGTRWVGELPES